MLRVDFYESGDGETIILTFPDGALGVVDGHPSSTGQRPPIADLVRGKQVHFVCLSHPHADHGIDLHQVFNAAANVGAYWHTVTHLHTFLFSITQQDKFPSAHNALIDQLRAGWAGFLLELYRKVMETEDATPGFIATLHAERTPLEIAGVEISFWAPEEAEQTQYVRIFQERLKRLHRHKPNENALSAIIAFKYGGNVILLGSDALLRNWRAAVPRYRKAHWPRATVLKVPHHGAAGSFSKKKNENYLTLCRSDSETLAVLFAGDAKHPAQTVFDELKHRTKLVCLSNGLKNSHRTSANPLDLEIPGAFVVAPTMVCNPHLGFEFHKDGSVRQTAGQQCSFCAR
jgi:hypothetical protein